MWITAHSWVQAAVITWLQQLEKDKTQPNTCLSLTLNLKNRQFARSRDYYGPQLGTEHY